MPDRLNTLLRVASQAPVPRLTYNPGPGIYSRLERAVEAMPANVRVEELPGLLKRHKEGVPGWELNAVDFPGVVGDARVVPRQDLLDAVRERSPVYTHREVVLGGRPQQEAVVRYQARGLGEEGFGLAERRVGSAPDYQVAPSPIGQGVSHGEPHYESYGQGGKDYTELLLLQPGQSGLGFGSHWSGRGLPLQDPAVAHARFDTHADALRINELQSDLGIHNRKVREAAKTADGMDAGFVTDTLPFPLEDAWLDLLIKRLMLEWARGGHRAIEIASPRAIADKVGGNIDNYEHAYGKVAPGAIERLGRKMGGVALDSVPAGVEPIRRAGYDVSRVAFRATDALNDAISHADGLVGRRPGQRTIGGPFEEMTDAMRMGEAPQQYAEAVYEQLARTAVENGWPVDAARTLVGRSMPYLMRRAEDVVVLDHQRARVADLARNYEPPQFPEPPARRYLPSDEMRRRILTQGIGASLLAPIAAGGMQADQQ